MACPRKPCPEHSVCPQDTTVIPPVTAKKFCTLCGEYFSEEQDQNHREACRDRNKP